MFYQIFLSLQVERKVNISNKYGIYELPHELPNDLRLLEISNQENLEISQNYCLVFSLLLKTKILSILSKNL